MTDSPDLFTPDPTQAEINRALWSACDTFRGVVDPESYKSYILTFLFFKYLSDVWADTRERLAAEHDDPALVARKLARQPFVIPDGETFADVVAKRNDTDLGQTIDTALHAIEDANDDRLGGVLTRVSYNSPSLGQTKDRNARLRDLVQNFARPLLDFRPSQTGKADRIGDAYMFLISMFASTAGKKGGEFYTPREVTDLLAELLDAQPGERVCDPAIGSGSLAIAVAEAVGGPDVALYGQESNGDTWALCQMNMVLHGFTGARVEWGNTLTEPRLLSDDGRLMTFDVVVANPPFSLKKWGHEAAARDEHKRFHRGMPPRSRGDYAFVSHIAETLAPGTGRAAIVVPHGVLFRGGAEGRIRRALLDEGLVEAVIGLPEKLFFGTGIPAAVLVLRRDRPTTDVLFIDASAHYTAGTRQNALGPDDVARITSAYRAFRDGGDGFQDKFSYRATRDQIAGNDDNLNIPRYVDTFEPAPAVDLAAVQADLDRIDGELADVRAEMRRHLATLGLADEVPGA